MYEKRFKAVSPQIFIADGSANGQITLSDTKLFKVKQKVILTAASLPNLELEVKRVDSINIMFVGPLIGNIDSRTDISSYTTALSAAIFANEQKRSSIPEQEIERLTYEEEPTVARRVTLVDPYGDLHDTSNPLPVEATINIGTVDTPIMFNVSALLSGTEYSQALPMDTAQFIMRARNNAKIQIAYTPGESVTKFLTIMPGNIYRVDGVKLSGKTLYFTSNKDDTIVEILAWT